MIEEIKTFIEVVECKNFTKAAKKINLSQPSVSVHIKRLENYFNTTLIDRSNKNRNVEVTETGYEVYEQGKKILSLLEQTQQNIKELSGITCGKLKIGASLTIGDYLLPKLLSKFREENPHIELEIIVENTLNICKKLNNLEIDIGLIEGIDTYYIFKKEPFYFDEMVLIVSKDSYILDGEFSVDKLQDQVWITREEGSGTQAYLKLFLSVYNIHPKNIITFSSNYAVKEAVKNNMGITLTSELVARESINQGDLIKLPINTDYKREFSYILSVNKDNSNALNIFLNTLNNL